MAQVTEFKIGDLRIDVHVRTDGTFFAEYDDEKYNANTLNELRETVTKAVRKHKDRKQQPVTLLGLVLRPKKEREYYSSEPYTIGRGFLHAGYRGQHARSQVPMFETSGNNPEHNHVRFSINRTWGRTPSTKVHVVRRLTDPEVEEYLYLYDALETAKQDMERFIASKAIDLKD